MSTRGIITALWPGFRKLLIAIGRWLIDVISDEGVRFLVGYIRQRVKVFKRRLARVVARRRRTTWRVRWLRGRISRWNAAATWLTHNAQQLRKRAVRLLGDKIDDAIPEDAPSESFRRWRRLQRNAA